MPLFIVIISYHRVVPTFYPIVSLKDKHHFTFILVCISDSLPKKPVPEMEFIRFNEVNMVKTYDRDKLLSTKLGLIYSIGLIEWNWMYFAPLLIPVSGFRSKAQLSFERQYTWPGILHEVHLYKASFIVHPL